MAQTSHDFEWLVCDDGSEDDTLALVEDWQARSPFDIIIRSFPRRVGKPVLDNDASHAARAPYFLQMGSDDALAPEGVERFLEAWDEIPRTERQGYAFINARSVTFEGERIGKDFGSYPVDTTAFDLCYRHRMHHDSVNCYQTRLRRMHPFPEVDYIVPESIVWVHMIGRDYRIRCIKDTLMIVSRDTPNATTGYPKMRYCRGYATGFAYLLNNPGLSPFAEPGIMLRGLINHGRLSQHSGIPLWKQVANLKRPWAKALTLLLAPVSGAISWRDRRLDKIEHTPFESFSGAPRVIRPPVGVPREETLQSSANGVGRPATKRSSQAAEPIIES